MARGERITGCTCLVGKKLQSALIFDWPAVARGDCKGGVAWAEMTATDHCYGALLLLCTLQSSLLFPPFLSVFSSLLFLPFPPLSLHSFFPLCPPSLCLWLAAHGCLFCVGAAAVLVWECIINISMDCRTPDSTYPHSLKQDRPAPGRHVQIFLQWLHINTFCPLPSLWFIYMADKKKKPSSLGRQLAAFGKIRYVKNRYIGPFKCLELESGTLPAPGFFSLNSSPVWSGH